ncbi:MAG: hypothetical protein DI598_03805 [Pseudopedobacter saltans]|uniref:DUF5683 domain-containing protein n=1 Tax=Pseudopedobacter saltans TaxID=151895 RepID=A0A2W5F4Z1_9SPHI|nr:MAG: hypothetical protein DI598_03805 [Pseudopedobacter saltans]
MLHNKKNIGKGFFCFFAVILFSFIGKNKVFAQNDRPGKDTVLAWDSSGKPVAVFDSTSFASIEKPKPHNPKKATMRSLILPGWGQAYNKQYWKIPIVWGALAIPGTAFIRNNNWYKDAASVYNIVYGKTQGTAQNASEISALLSGHKDYQEYWDNLYANNSATATTNFLSTVQSNRNYYRRNRDYSVLWLLILWGVNVADATVFGHLKDFDISPNLSMEVNPTYLQSVRGPGLSLVFNLK